MEFDSRYQQMSLPVGSSLKLNIGVEGEPAPHITWYKDGAKLAGRGHAAIETTDYMTSLGVRRVGRDDAGEYCVVAKNEWGMSDARFNVNIMGE